MSAQGIGASLSPAVGDWLAQWRGYPVAFLLLGAFAIGWVMLWTSCAALIRKASSGEAGVARVVVEEPI
jgi:hypothetical protein